MTIAAANSGSSGVRRRYGGEHRSRRGDGGVYGGDWRRDWRRACDFLSVGDGGGGAGDAVTVVAVMTTAGSAAGGVLTVAAVIGDGGRGAVRWRRVGRWWRGG